MRKFLSLFFSLSLLIFSAFAQGGEKTETRGISDKRMAFRGFCGGMMLHTGYLWSAEAIYSVAGTSESLPLRVRGVPTGLGGALKFRFGKHLRVGGEGHVSNMNYGEHKSHITIGWGGLIIESMWEWEKCRLFAGGLVGGGSQRNIALLEADNRDFVTETKAAYRKYGFFALIPYIGAEVPVHRKISLVFKADYMFNVKPQDDFASGFRVFAGVVFGHSK